MSKINGVHFPRRILGCKDRVVPDGRSLADVVADIIAAEAGKNATVWDGFAGSAYCGLVFKRHGYVVVSSDIRPSAWLRAAGLVGANTPAIAPSTVEDLAKATPTAEGVFTKNEKPLIGSTNAAWLDALRERLPSLGEGERLAAVLGVNMAFETMLQRGDRFFHIKRSIYNDILCGGWHMRDKLLASEWRRLMLEDYPKLIADNGRTNPCHMADALTLASSVTADAAYFDPPYAALFSSYQGCYDIVDEWPALLLGQSLPDEAPHKAHLRFSAPDNAIASFALLMNRSKHIPLWIISYSDSDTMRVKPEEIAMLAKGEGRTTEIQRFPFPRARCRKADGPQNYNECLIVCRSRTAATKTPEGSHSPDSPITAETTK